jgi:hypothetical protein
LVQLSQFCRPSSAACAFSTEPKYATLQRLPRVSETHSSLIKLSPSPDTLAFQAGEEGLLVCVSVERGL